MKATNLLPIIASLTLVSCGDKNTADLGDTDGAKKSLAAFLLSDAPSGAISIQEARKNPTPGTKVVLSGKVMGKEEPLIKSRAMLTLGDPAKMVSCDLRPGDGCETPWDVCCDLQEVIKANIATIQILGDDGKPLTAGLRGLGGLKELSSLVVVGEVAEGSNENNFLVNATGIHVAMAEATKENPAGLPDDQ